jgi:ribosomal-protein-alanine N-acetyltransferase
MNRALHEAQVSIRNMRHDDLTHVSDIERRSYTFPWSHGVFRDCLLAGYQCVVLEREGAVSGYAILSVAAGEAHILNICIEPAYRSIGYGARLLDEVLFRVRATSVREIFLEVRPTNSHALALYRKKGFHNVAKRPAYYQAESGREDAAVLVKKLTADR